MSEPLTAEEIAQVRRRSEAWETAPEGFDGRTEHPETQCYADIDRARLLATLDAATPAPADLRTMLPPCRPPHGSLDDLLFGDATVEEQRARLATLDAARPSGEDVALDNPGVQDNFDTHPFDDDVARPSGDVDALLAAVNHYGPDSPSLRYEFERILDGRREEGT